MAQRRLQSMLGGGVARRSTGDLFTPSSPHASRLGASIAKCAELRELLGLAASRENEWSEENGSLRAMLRVERDKHNALKQAHTTQACNLDARPSLLLTSHCIFYRTPPEHITTSLHHLALPGPTDT